MASPDSNSLSSGNEKDSKDRSRLKAFFSSKAPPPPKKSVQDATILPESVAGWFSLLTFSWMTPLLSLGYARPLEAPDLYKLQDNRSAAYIAEKIVTSFEARQRNADAYNVRLANGEISPGLSAVWWTIRGNRKEKEKQWREVTGKKKASLVYAMNDSIKWWFWSAGLLKVIGDTAQVTSPLLVKAIIKYAAESFYEHRIPRLASKVPSVGKGIGLVFALLALQLISSLCSNHFFYRSTSSGVLLRGGLITAIYSRSLRLTARARSTLTNGKLVNHISTDVSRIDFCCGFFHMSWTAPIQLAICLALLIQLMGVSALAGFAVFVVATPVQMVSMKQMFKMRQSSMQWTDKRAKLLQELLGGMKIIKFFAWEVPFLNRIFGYRRNEMKFIRSLLVLRSALFAVAMSLPTISSVVALVTYTVTGHDFDPAVVFTAITLFNLLRLPLMFLPMSLNTITDAASATQRLYAVFEAETLEDTHVTELDLPNAIEVRGASFTWDSPPPDIQEKKKRKRHSKEVRHSRIGRPSINTNEPVEKSKSGEEDTQEKKERKCHSKDVRHSRIGRPSVNINEPVEKSKSGEENIFKMEDITLSIPREQLVAIVGPVGTGKTSLLQGIIGEMRKTAGSIKFGGSVAYCPQVAWIQNATIRENVCFGRPFEEQRYWNAVRSACLEPDLEMLPNGDLTEVGERGISLSGGQKQRVNICRAIYCDTDIQIFDDPLSALDAHVGKAVFQNVFQDRSSKKTRILVTHGLHFLPHVDYIYTVTDGRISESGTYAQLMANHGEFSRFITEFGSQEEENNSDKKVDDAADDNEKKSNKKYTQGAGMMQSEERNIGAVNSSVYLAYLSAGKGQIVVPLLVLSLVLLQGSQIIWSYWLVYWQEMKFHKSQAFYMGVFAGLGITQSIAMFLTGSAFSLLTYFSSQRLHSDSIKRVMHAPMSFFDTTPLGRIMNRFSKDIDTIDNQLGESLRMFANTLSSIIGAVVLISIVVPWFLIAVGCISVCYVYAALFYRASARELKRLDAILRSSLYAHFSESLSGLTTIRAYGESKRFRTENEEWMDIENRAYWLTVSNQRWLGIRLDFLGTMLTFAVGILTVATRFKISPANTGLTLSYILSVQAAFGWMVRQVAEVENNMNSVERMVHYAREIEQEAPAELPDQRPNTTWPAEGRIEFKDAVLSYRPELPTVLKGLSMSIGAREKVGIVGRTGAGKSSIMTALYRLVELTSGSITIDDVDISKIGLNDLRNNLSIIPQDPLLFSGTLRSNLDPFDLHSDAELWDALRRSYLVDTMKKDSLEDDQHGQDKSTTNRFNLDTPIEEEGNNLSIGQRSLVSLARALVKDTKILILDEATASVDYETDRKIQNTIANEFHDRTILCIAHRLRTVIAYDRVCVLDSGRIAEFDTPENLYAIPDGIFRGMCDRSSISLDDIKSAAKLNNEVDR